MALVVISLHERDVPLDVLGRLAVGDEELAKALATLGGSPHLSERVILSTCMRTEVYAVAERFHDGISDIQAFFEDRLGESTTTGALLESALMVEFDESAARHLFAEAAGIDSPVLGEGEILRQVREAHARSRDEGATGPVLDGLFHHAVEVGKRVRTETRIAKGTTSLAHVAVALAARHLGGSLSGKKVVVVGAGVMGEGLVSALAPSAKEASVVVANRSHPHAVTLARRLRGRGVSLDALFDELADADVLFSATASAEVHVSVDDLRRLRRRAGPLLVVDAAVPRDVDPEVAGLEGVTLVDVDDLRADAERELEARRGEVARVEEILDEELERYVLDARGRSAAPLVASLRARAEQVRASELDRVDSVLQGISPDQRAAIDQATRRIVAKLVHEPTVKMKRAAGTPKGERLAEALRALFDL